MRLILALLCMTAPAFAEEAACPAVPDHAQRKAELLRDLSLSRDSADAGIISDELWDIWTDAPDDRAQALLDQGMDALRRNQFDDSIALLSELVAYCPDFAEGWNQRAFAEYLSRDYEGALADIDRVLALEPRHVPALAGKAQTLMRLGRDDEAQLALRDAVRLNPWLWERELLTIPLDIDI